MPINLVSRKRTWAAGRGCAGGCESGAENREHTAAGSRLKELHTNSAGAAGSGVGAGVMMPR